MDTLPTELICLIYNLLPHWRPKDVVSLASTCNYLRDSMPNELARILSIRRKYVNINATITNDIQYFISEPYHGPDKLLKRSLRIVNTTTVAMMRSTLYVNVKMNSDERMYRPIGAYLPHGRNLIGDISSHPIDKWIINNCFHSIRNKLYKEYMLV